MNGVGHLNLIHPNRIQVLGEAEVEYYQRQTDEDRSRHMAELIALEPPFLVVAGGVAAPPELVLRCTRSSTPLFTTPMSPAAVIDSLRLYMSRILAPRATLRAAVRRPRVMRPVWRSYIPPLCAWRCRADRRGLESFRPARSRAASRQRILMAAT